MAISCKTYFVEPSQKALNYIYDYTPPPPPYKKLLANAIILQNILFLGFLLYNRIKTSGVSYE